MATAAQIAANRANAQHSTGPRTEEGKLASRENSTSHGFTGQAIVRLDDQDAAYLAFFDSMLPDLAPANAFERNLAGRIIHDCWRLDRAAAADENLITCRMIENGDGPGCVTVPDGRAIAAAGAFRDEAKTLNLLSLYEQRLQRAVHKNLALLKALQKERQARPVATQQSAPAPKVDVKPSPQPVEIPTPSPEIGFVFATAAGASTPPRQPVAA